MNDIFHDKINELVHSISENLGIYRGDNELSDDYLFRLIYSAIGRMAYCTLFDRIDGKEEISLKYFSRRIEEFIKSYNLLFPDIYLKHTQSMDLKKTIRELYEENGLLYYRTLYVRPSHFNTSTFSNISFFRGVSPTKNIMISGLGMYKKEDGMKAGEVKDICKFFQVDESITNHFWVHILEELSFHSDFDILSGDVEFLNIKNLNNGYWGSKIESDETIFRTLDKKIYCLCRRGLNGWDIAELPITIYDPYLLVNTFLHSIGKLPSSRFKVLGNIVRLHIGFRYPQRLRSFVNLYSWPLGDAGKSTFNRVIQADVFWIIKTIGEYLGYDYVQE